MATKLIHTQLVTSPYDEYCDDCDTLIKAGELAVMAVRMHAGPRVGILLRLHRTCAKDLGGDLALELTRA